MTSLWGHVWSGGSIYYSIISDLQSKEAILFLMQSEVETKDIFMVTTV